MIINYNNFSKLYLLTTGILTIVIDAYWSIIGTDVRYIYFFIFLVQTPYICIFGGN